MAPKSKSRSTGGPAVGESSSSAPETLRRRSTVPGPDAARRPSAAGLYASELLSEDRSRRRSSTFSTYTFSDVNRDFQEEIVDPGPKLGTTRRTWKALLPVLFAVIPPIAGLLFKNGADFFTDLTLLGLASIFLHWSTTAPWKWYFAAQQVREDKEAELERTSDLNDDTPPSEPGSERKTPSPAEKFEELRQVNVALERLRRLEVTALISCFLGPAAGSYMLCFVRDHLSRPSGGIVSNFNVGIFLLAAEVRPLSHSIKLLLAHTLHLQQIVNSNPYRMLRMTPERYNAILSRIEDLEARVLAPQPEPFQPDGSTTPKPRACVCEGCICGADDNNNINNNPQQQKQKATAARQQLREEVARDVRAAITPEIDAVVRAVRRYEKKTSTLTTDTDQRLLALQRRLDDAIAVSAMVARNHADRWSLGRVVTGGGMYVAGIPMAVTAYGMGLVLAPLNWVLSRAAGRERERKVITEAGETTGGGRGAAAGRKQIGGLKSAMKQGARAA